MGDSKIIMLSAIYLIVGMFLYSSHFSSLGESFPHERLTNHKNAEMIAWSGISLALDKMGMNRSLNTFRPEFREMDGGRVSVHVAQPLGTSMIQSTITAVGISGTDTVTIFVIATFDRGRWRLSGVFPPPAA